MRSVADLLGGSPLVSFDHVTDLHFVTFSSSLYTIINPNPNTNPNPYRNPKRNPTVTTDPQIGPRDLQIVTVQIRPSDPLRSVFCPVPKLHYITSLHVCFCLHVVRSYQS